MESAEKAIRIVAGLAKQVKDLKQSNDALRTSKEVWKEQAERTEQRTQCLRNKCDTLHMKCNAYEGINHNQEIDGLHGTISQLENEIAIVTKSREEWKEDVETHRTKSHKQAERVKGLEGDLNEAHQMIKSMKKREAILTSNLSALITLGEVVELIRESNINHLRKCHGE